MTEISDIRNLYYEQGLSKSEIHEKTGFDLQTIRKYLNQENFNLEVSVKTSKITKLTPYHETIDAWLENDKKFHKKQRHTAKRVFDRLKEEFSDFSVSYRSVANYCKAKKKAIWHSHGFLPLEHPMGEAQVDFGKTEYLENGEKISGSHLVMSFPYSNAAYVQLFPGETAECLLEGMKRIFNYIGGVPTTIRFDNASSMVVKVKEGGKRDLTDIFVRFKNHYNFTSSFCNPASGHEKGHVENKVGYTRRNMFVPAPSFNDIEEFNKEHLVNCDKDMNRVHYKRKKLISLLFAEEKAELQELPKIEFEVCRYNTSKADSYGKIKLEAGKRVYSTCPSMANTLVQLKQTAFYIYIFDKNLKTVVKHKRLYGKKQESMDWMPYLQQLSRRPGALKYTKVYEMLPDKLQQQLQATSKSDCGKILKAIAEVTKLNSFKDALLAVESAIDCGVVTAESIILANSRNNTFSLPIIQHNLPQDLPQLPSLDTSCKVYDSLMGGSKANAKE